MTASQPDGPRRISFTPAVPDGPDRPWTRGRRTRWWAVVPADLLTVALVGAFSAAAVHRLELVGTLVLQGLAALVLGWAVAWAVSRPDDHLEAVDRRTAALVAVVLLVWLGLGTVAGTGAGEYAAALTCFLVAGLVGWRWLYGFVKASESITPKGIQRRLDAQSAAEDERPQA